MIKHFTWALLGMASMAQAMDDPKDDEHRDKHHYLSMSNETNTPAATASTTSDVKPVVEPAHAATPQTSLDNKKPYYPELQCDPVRGVWYISLIPEKSPRRPQPAKNPQTSDVKPTVTPATVSNDNEEE